MNRVYLRILNLYRINIFFNNFVFINNNSNKIIVINDKLLISYIILKREKEKKIYIYVIERYNRKKTSLNYISFLALVASTKRKEIDILS